jgi:hypothetical protein
MAMLKIRTFSPGEDFPLISNFKRAGDRTLVQHVLGKTAQPPLMDAPVAFSEASLRSTSEHQQTPFQASPRLWETSATADTVLPRKTSDLPLALSNCDVLHEGWRVGRDEG